MAPRPVPPKGFDFVNGIIEACWIDYRETSPMYWAREVTQYTWFDWGGIRRFNPDGSVTMWSPKPTLHQAVARDPTGACYRFFDDGSVVRSSTDEQMYFWSEEREVERPSNDGWVTPEDVDMGNDHPDLMPEGWYCRGCDSSRCQHVSAEKTKLNNTQYDGVCC